MSQVEMENLRHRILSEDDDGTASLRILMAVLIGLICVLHFYCVWSMCKPWFLRTWWGIEPQDEMSLMHQGRQFILSRAQRRAVLEALFSGASKNVTEEDVEEAHYKARAERKAIKNEVQIVLPMDITGTESTLDSPPRMQDVAPMVDDEEGEDDDLSEEDDLQIATTLAVSSPYHKSLASLIFRVDSGVRSAREAMEGNVFRTPTASFDVESQQATPIRRNTQSPESPSAKEDQELRNKEEIDGALKLPWLTVEPGIEPLALDQRKMPARRTSGEAKDEITTENMTESSNAKVPVLMNAPDEFTVTSSLAVPMPLVRLESLTTAASQFTYKDDDTSTVTSSENCCPICLSGYQQGDVLIAAPHCIHSYHKECIFSWLEKHQDCPVCRAEMFNEEELQETAGRLMIRTQEEEGTPRVLHPYGEDPTTTPSRMPTSPGRRGLGHLTARRAESPPPSPELNSRRGRRGLFGMMSYDEDEAPTATPRSESNQEAA